jgi:hypothetical protein
MAESRSHLAGTEIQGRTNIIPFWYDLDQRHVLIMLFRVLNKLNMPFKRARTGIIRVKFNTVKLGEPEGYVRYNHDELNF